MTSLGQESNKGKVLHREGPSIGLSRWKKWKGVVTIQREPGMVTERFQVPQNGSTFQFQLCLFLAKDQVFKPILDSVSHQKARLKHNTSQSYCEEHANTIPAHVPIALASLSLHSCHPLITLFSHNWLHSWSKKNYIQKVLCTSFSLSLALWAGF